MSALQKIVLNICDLYFLIILSKKWTLSLDSVTFSRAFLFRLLFSCLHILKNVTYWFCFNLQAHGRKSQADPLEFRCPRLYWRLFQNCGVVTNSHCGVFTKSFSGSNFKISLSTQNPVSLWHWKYRGRKMAFKSSWCTHKTFSCWFVNI